MSAAPSRSDPETPAAGASPAAASPGSPSPQAASWERLLDRVAAVLFFVTLAAFALHQLRTYDLWWQLATGEWIRENGWPETDPFSYWRPDQPWIELRWIFCVTTSLLHDAFGVSSLVVAKAAGLMATFALMARLSPTRWGWTTNLALTSGLTLAHYRFMVRPELVSFALVALLWFCLERYKSGGHRRWIFAFPVIQVIWVNTHTLFVLGPVVLGIFTIAEALGPRIPFLDRDPRPIRGRRLRDLGIVTGLTGLACLLNPWFFRGAVFPLQLFRQIASDDSGPTVTMSLKDVISEFQGPLVNFGSLFSWSWVAIIVLSGATFLVTRRQLVASRLAIWGAFLFLSFLAVRNVSLFGYAATYAMILNLAEAPGLSRRVAAAVRVALPVLFLVLIPLVVTNTFQHAIRSEVRFGTGLSQCHYPIRSLEFIRREKLPGRILASLGDSSYFLYEGGPKSVFFDGRLEVYGQDNVVTGIQLIQSGNGFDEVTGEVGVRTVVMRHRYRPLIQQLERSPRWIPVFFDHLDVVYLRLDPDTAELAGRLKIDWTNPGETVSRALEESSDFRIPHRLGLLLLEMGNYPDSRRLLETAYGIYPDRETCLYLGLMRRADGVAGADEILARVPSSIWQHPDTHTAESRILEVAGHPRRALDASRTALKLAQEAGQDRPSYYENPVRLAGIVGDPNAVRDGLTAMTRAHPSHVRAWNNLGRINVQLNRPQDAILALKRSLTIQPRQASIIHLLGTVYANQGDFRQARGMFERALLVDPDHEPSGRDLRRLKQMGG